MLGGCIQWHEKMRASDLIHFEVNLKGVNLKM